MNRHLQVTNMNLAEDLAAAGVPFAPADLNAFAAADAHSIVAMAGLGQRARSRRQSTLAESYEPGSSAQDPIDGPYVTRSLMARVLELPFGAMKVEDFTKLMGELETKEVPAGDPELEEQVVEFMSVLKSLRESAPSHLDSRYTNRETLSRIIALPLERLSESDLAELTGELSSKLIPENDAELRRLHGQVVVALQEAKRISRRIQGGKIIGTKRTSGKEKIAGMKYRRKPTAARAQRKREKRRASGKFSKAEKMNMRRSGDSLGDRKQAARKAVYGEDSLPTESVLASELRGLIEASGPSGPYDQATSRIGRIFALIDEMADSDEVSDVLESAWENLEASLTEDTDEDDFLEAVTPALRLIKRCMESIDAGELGAGDSKNA